MNIFLDTNVLLSAFYGSGLCNELFHELIVSEHQILVSVGVIEEFERISVHKLHAPEDALGLALEVIRRQRVVPLANEPIEGIPDPDDAPIIASALAAASDIFVTGDKALLEMEEVAGLPVIRPREAWTRVFGE